MRTHLTLKRETLSELTRGELTAVVAASAGCPVNRLIDKIAYVVDDWVKFPTEEGCTPAYGV